MQPHGEGRDLRDQLREALREASRLSALIQRAESAGRHTKPERPKLTLIRGGKAVLAAPFVWIGSQLRDHAAAAVPLAAASVVGVPVTLGMASTPPVPNDPEPASITRLEEPDSFDDYFHWQVPTPTPSPLPTGAVEVVEPEVIPPGALPAPTSAPTLLPEMPLPTVTPLPEAVEPVEVMEWTTSTAVDHCREVLLAVDLHGCVRQLLESA
jgi:hypothetical protein